MGCFISAVVLYLMQTYAKSLRKGAFIADKVGVQNYFYIESALSGRRCFLRVREHSGLCDRGRRGQMRLENVLPM